MRLAIMQPYLFPYVGYFQLMRAVDRFVIYDDVNFIKQGWINRNHILLNGQPHLFTMPVTGAGSFMPINTIRLGNDYTRWRGKFLKTISQAYRQAPCYQQALPVVERALPENCTSLTDLLVGALCAVTDFLEMTTTMVPTSSHYGNSNLRGQDRVIDICCRERATTYINSTGGRHLYSKTAFSRYGITLFFLRANLPKYHQFDDSFQPNLSIIDAMMFVPPGTLLNALSTYELE